MLSSVSGNIGTDLMIKIIQNSEILEATYLVGIDPNSDGLKRAEKFGVKPVSTGLAGLEKEADFEEVKIFFDATSAKAHHHNFELLKKYSDKQMIDLTPAAIGPYVVPAVNLEANLTESNINMVTCGGQATIPIVNAVSQVAKVHYGEIIASISSKSAGAGTRANIDEFTETTSKAIEKVGGATKGRAIIILNPAKPPLLMRNTVLVLSEKTEPEKIRSSVHKMVQKIQGYVPGYQLKQQVEFEEINNPVLIEGVGEITGLKNYGNVRNRRGG